MKKYHVSFDDGSGVHGLTVRAKSEDDAKAKAAEKISAMLNWPDCADCVCAIERV